jgi:hypothetical protein
MDFASEAMKLPAIRLVLSTWLALTTVGAPAILADPGADESKGFAVKVLLDNLDHPCGIDLRRPGSGELFLAESGAGRVLRVRLNDPAESTVAIDGFPRAQIGTEAKYSLGPLSVAFVDRTTLIVGEGGQPKGADAVRVYQLPDDGKTLAFDKSKHTLRAAPTDRAAAKAGDFFAVAVQSSTVYAGSNGDAAGWVFKADTAGLTPPVLKRFIATRQETGASAPRAIVLSKRGELIVAQAGEFGGKRDSVLCFYNAASGKRLLKLDTGLFDIVGLASATTTSELLYAVDFSAADPSAGGLFRLDMDVRDGRQAIKAVKLLPLDRPAGLVIASTRELYVTTFGGGKVADGDGKMGQLLKIEKTNGDL